LREGDRGLRGMEEGTGGEASRDGGKGKTEEMGRREGEGEISPPQSFLEVVAYG